MFKKALLAATAASMVAIPGAASAQYYPGYGYNDGYGYDYRDQRRYEREQRRYERQQRRYANQYGNYYGRRCSGTTGTIVGGVAGALIGREVAKGRRDYYGYRRGGDKTAGAIIGGAVGALVGREVGKRSCR